MSLVSQGDLILALDERGILYLIRATPEELEVIDSRRVSDAPTWAHLAVSGDQLIVRELNAITVLRWREVGGKELQSGAPARGEPSTSGARELQE